MLPYEDLAFLTKDGKEVKMSALVLAALNASLMNSLSRSQDFEDCCVVTEFSQAELEEVKSLYWSGQCNLNLAAGVLKELGIHLDSMVYPGNHVETKIEVKKEFDFGASLDSNLDFDYLPEPEDIPVKGRKRKRKKKEGT